jgi:hypothetical protein
VETIAAIGQTFPPVAVLAIAVPVMGFGQEPAIIALILYGVLPVAGHAGRDCGGACVGAERGGRDGNERLAAAAQG